MPIWPFPGQPNSHQQHWHAPGNMLCQSQRIATATGLTGEGAKARSEISRATTVALPPRASAMVNSCRKTSQGTGRVSKNPKQPLTQGRGGRNNRGTDTRITRVDPKTYGHLTTRGVTTPPFTPEGKMKTTPCRENLSPTKRQDNQAYQENGRRSRGR